MFVIYKLLPCHSLYDGIFPSVFTHTGITIMHSQKSFLTAYTYLFSAISLALLLTACGGGGGGNPAGATGSAVTAVAGASQDLAKNTLASLDGSGSSHSAGATLIYIWTQTYGPDVTGGTGALHGETPSFTAPDEVCTLLFTLRVDDGNGNSATDTLQVNVLEHTGDSFYVDGDNGSDITGDGSRANPFASISHAMDNIPGPNHDIYVKTRANSARYDESNEEQFPPSGTSLYGGYNDDWVRDVNTNRTGVDGYYRAFTFTNVDADAWFSGFDLKAGNSLGVRLSVFGIMATSGTAALHIQDNIISAGNVGPGVDAAPGSSYGIHVANLDAVRILRNDITAGNGGNGANGTRPAKAKNGGDGGNASGRDRGTGGSRGSRTPEDNVGGCGGTGGGIGGGDGGKACVGSGRAPQGNIGGLAGIGATSGSRPNGSGGGWGYGGPGGNGGDGATGDGSLTAAGFFKGAAGARGARGNQAGGGGGGGGGNGGVVVTAGGGGGGGGGGAGGAGGTPGYSGGASIGIAITAVPDAWIEDNIVVSASGGNGGDGGAGGEGGDGGDGGRGANGASNITGDQGGGGGGGAGGGKGGEGGQGGGGGGGPSYAIMIGATTAVTIQNNTLTSGTGGQAGSGGIGGFIGNQGDNGSQSSTKGRGGAGGAGETSYSNRDRGTHQYDGANGQPAQGGWSYGIYDSDNSDGAPTVSGNTISAGTAGAGGSSGTRNF